MRAGDRGRRRNLGMSEDEEAFATLSEEGIDFAPRTRSHDGASWHA
jgi:hypothetical protein